MINKKNIWFLTLFSLILVLSVYYITMPSELLLTNSSNFSEEDETEPTVSIEESEVITALKVSDEEELQAEITKLKSVITDSKSTTDEKNEAFDKMKKLNINKALEEEIEKKLNETYSLDTFVKIEDSNVKVVVNSSEHDASLANNIMNTVQENFDSKMYITVEFKG